MKETNVVNLEIARAKNKKECGKSAYGRYLRLLENDQLETEINYILGTMELHDQTENINLRDKSDLIMEELASRTSSTFTQAIIKMKEAIADQDNSQQLN